MATCKDCLHCEACSSMLKDLGYTVDGDGLDADKRCATFTSNTALLELARKNLDLMLENETLKCKYQRLRETADILDAALREYQQKYGE